MRNEAIAVVSAITAVLLISAVSDAPIGGPADSSGIPVENVKAPWIFLGIQQMLRYFPAVIGGVIIPLAGLLMLTSIPFVSTKVDQPVQVGILGNHSDFIGSNRLGLLCMSGRAFPSRIITVVLLAIIALVMAMVEHRYRSPEWKVYQQKGVALALHRLEMRLAEEQSAVAKRLISSEIDSLKNMRREIIDITPFGGKLPAERCLTCHYGIEDLSLSHPNLVFGCVTCHGGNGYDLSVRGAHIGLRGGRNPAKLDLLMPAAVEANPTLE